MSPASIPRRAYVLGTSLMRGQVSLLVAPPGAGKSTFALARGIAVCTGCSITSEAVYETGKVWVYNNEDDRDELERRVIALLQHHDIPFPEIEDRLALSSGAEYPLLLAKLARGEIVPTPDVEACIKEIKRNDIAVFIADPFAEMHEALENSNEQIKRVGQIFRDIARRGNCAVLLVHHTAKPVQGGDSQAGNMHTSRGASALAGIARVVETMFPMNGREAYQHNIPEAERHRYVRLDDAKANFSLVSGQPNWLRRTGVLIGNGDEVGVLEATSLRKPYVRLVEDADFHEHLVAGLLAEMKETQISLNAAATRLAWGEDMRFHKYREVDKTSGKQRATKPLREAIAAACRLDVRVKRQDGIHGFHLLDGEYPVQLRRYAVRQASASEDSENK